MSHFNGAGAQEGPLVVADQTGVDPRHASPSKAPGAVSGPCQAPRFIPGGVDPFYAFEISVWTNEGGALDVGFQ